jgi:hypothetical protein
VRHHFRRFDSWVGASKGQDMVVIVHTYTYIHISYLILYQRRSSTGFVGQGRGANVTPGQSVRVVLSGSGRSPPRPLP